MPREYISSSGSVIEETGSQQYVTSKGVVVNQTLSSSASIAGSVGDSVASGPNAVIGNIGSTVVNGSIGDTVATGIDATIVFGAQTTISSAVGACVSQGSTATTSNRIVSDVIINNTGTILGNTSVFWTWTPNGRIGVMEGMTPQDGAGTTDASGKLSTGIILTTGRLDIAVRGSSASEDAVYQQYF